MCMIICECAGCVCVCVVVVVVGGGGLVVLAATPTLHKLLCCPGARVIRKLLLQLLDLDLLLLLTR